MTAPEDANKPTLLKQTIEGARTHLVALTTYLASLAALVGGHHVLTKKLEYSNLEALLFASIPLVLSLLFLTLPAWLKRRREAKLRYFGIHGKLEDPGYFLLRPYEARDRDRFRRPDDADADVLDWIRTTQEPLLYLTGRSGAGKSSLLGASVLPQLQEGTDPAFHVISVRSYRDPSDELRQALREPGAIWQSPPEDGLRRLLEKAAAHLGPKRLLVVVDQFEELLILHDDGEQHEFVELLRSLHDDPIPGLCVLLSARSDYLGPIGDLELGSLELRKTWMEISPFTEMAARSFLEDSGLGLDEKRMDDLIKEAAEIEETRGQIRPITLNLLGVVVSRQGSRPLKSGRVLRDYLAEAIEENELSDCARQILESLITDVGTKEPRSVEEITGHEALDDSMVRGGLLRLGNLGLVRQIDPERGVWEISHDFLARLLGSIIGRWRRPWLQGLRPWIAPLGLVLWLAVVGVSIQNVKLTQHARAIESLVKIDFKVERIAEGFSVHYIGSSDRIDLETASNFMKSLDGDVISFSLSSRGVGVNSSSPKDYTGNKYPRTNNIINLTQVANLSTLAQFTKIKDLKLSVSEVEDITPLSKLTALRRIDLSYTKVFDLSPLGRVPGIQHLDLRGTMISKLDPLSRLVALQYLDLSGTQLVDSGNSVSTINPIDQRSLRQPGNEDLDLKFLSRLIRIEYLNLSGTKVADLKPLEHLTSLQHLDLADTKVLDIEPLSQLNNIRHLDLAATYVVSFTPLNRLTKLEHLDLSASEFDLIRFQLRDMTEPQSGTAVSYSPLIDDVTPLRELIQLRHLDLSGREFDNFTFLSHHPMLSYLGLGRTNVRNLEPLSELSELRTLDLYRTKVEDLTPLRRLSRLQELDLRLTEVEDLTPIAVLTRRGLRIER